MASSGSWHCAVRWRRRRLHILGVALTLACADDPAGPDPAIIEAGRAAFAEHCASCHTARDGFDLAFFGFAASDIIRRGVKHVDEPTARSIVSYIESLGVRPIGREVAPFQPGRAVAPDDARFWGALFGTSGWPASLSAAGLAAIDPRTVDVPLVLPLWSVEEEDTDWLPVAPLADVMDTGNALDHAIESYYAAPSGASLLTLVARFEEKSAAPGNVCHGPAAAVPARDCFEARRWISALAALHFLRNPGEPVPIEVADLWWNTGEAAILVFLRETAKHPRRMASSWLYLAWTFAPHRFPDPGGYLIQFLVNDGYPRFAAFVTLRRMVSVEPIYNALPAQRFEDALIAIRSAPAEFRADVAEFEFRFLRDWLDRPAAAAELRNAEPEILVRLIFAEVERLPASLVPEPRRQSLAALRDALLTRLLQAR